MANSIDAFIPELWAQESLMILEANMVAANLVHRDFSDQIAAFGDVVNTRKPAAFTARRKIDSDDVTDQNADATNVPVLLDQHPHTTFIIKDGEESKSFKQLRDEYLVPAVSSLSQFVDQIVLMQMYGFLANLAGSLDSGMNIATITAARQVLLDNKAPFDWNMVIPPAAENDLLNIEAFTSAEKVGDDGTALREASLGRKFGFDIFIDQNAPSIATGSTIVTGAVNLTAGYAIGSTSIVVDGFSAAITLGAWCTIGGDMTPQMITGTVGGSTPTTLTISPGLVTAVVNDAVVTVYTPGAGNLTAGYAIGYAKQIVVDGFTVAPKVGQMMTHVATGSTVAKHGIISGASSAPLTTAIDLDRPLVTALANDAVIGIGPAGEYSLAFHRNAIALVSRPLAPPAPGTGALSFTASFNGVSMRVTITYDGKAQGHRVTVDMLCGIKLLDAALGVLVLS